MTVRLKALGLALAAAFALSAVVASAASAQSVHSGSASGFTYATADQHEENVFITSAGNVKCNVITGDVKYTGTTATEATVTGLGYDGCSAFGLEAHVDTMGCTYILKAVNATTGTAQISCPTTAGGVTDEITILPTQGGAAICHISVEEQTINVKVENKGATPSGIPDDLDVEPESTTIKYSTVRTVGGAKCPANGTQSNGSYKGKITVTGFENSAHTIRTGLTYN